MAVSDRVKMLKSLKSVVPTYTHMEVFVNFINEHVKCTVPIPLSTSLWPTTVPVSTSYTDFFFMREASSKRVCPSVRQSVTLPLQICKMQKNTREKVHIVSAREISTFLCVEMDICLKILAIDSEREISTFNFQLFFLLISLCISSRITKSLSENVKISCSEAMYQIFRHSHFDAQKCRNVSR